MGQTDKNQVRHWEAVEMPEYLSCTEVKLLPKITGGAYLLPFKNTLDFKDKICQEIVQGN